MNPSVRNQLLWFVSFLFFWGGASFVSASEATSLKISGKIVNATHSTQCLMQLLKPVLEPVIKDVTVRGDFDIDWPYSMVTDDVIVSILCDGYEVYASKPLAHSIPTFDVGVVDAKKRLDVDQCRVLTGAQGEMATQELLSIFISEVKLPRGKMGVSRPSECADRVYLMVEGLEEFSGPGQHWIVEKAKKNGIVTVDQGI